VGLQRLWLVRLYPLALIVHAIGGTKIGNSPALPWLIVEEAVPPGYGLVFLEDIRKPSLLPTDDITRMYHQIEAEVPVDQNKFFLLCFSLGLQGGWCLS
jgi:hypothetical protein